MSEISIIVPAYNSARFLPGCVASVAAQRGVRWELLVVDDGSTDDTWETALDIQETGVSVLRHPGGRRLGVSASRNLALRAARSPFVGFLDADDRYAPDWLETALEWLRKEKDAGLVCGRFSFLEEGPPRPEALRRAHDEINTEFQNEEAIPFHRFLRNNPVRCSTVVGRRELFLEAGGFEESFDCAEDWLLWSQVAFSHYAVFLESSAAVCSWHPDSWTARNLHLLDAAAFEELRTRFLIRLLISLEARGLLAQRHRNLALELGRLPLDAYPKKAPPAVLRALEAPRGLGWIRDWPRRLWTAWKKDTSGACA